MKPAYMSYIKTKETDMICHRIKHLTKTGANQTYRLQGAPDCDSAAAYVVADFGGEVLSVEAIDVDEPRVWGEWSIGEFRYMV